jgi:tRNA pseudouridine13 synthase
MLARWLRQHCLPEDLHPVTLRLGSVPFHAGLDAARQQELAALQLPLPTSRMKLDPADPRAELVQAVLAEEGLALRDLQVRGVREMFFSRGGRAALCVPRDLTFAFADDDRQPGRLKLTLAFDLPRGCYATLIVKAAVAR